jgi:adenosine deaminase
MKLFAGLVALSAAIAAPPAATLEQRFSELRARPPELYQFLVAMPKGSDLHNHLTGAVYAETYVRIAAEDGLCVDLRSYALIARPRAASGKPPCGDNAADAGLLRTDNDLANAVIDSLSMRGFVPGRETAHDHFFAAFGKFGPSRAEHEGEFIAEVVQRAADQNESYLELMVQNGTPANALGSKVGFDGDFDRTREMLMRAGLAEVVGAMRTRVDRLEQSRIAALGCGAHPDSAACRVEVGYLYAILRESPKEQAFAQTLAGFMLASQDPRVVGVNIVQPEDGLISMRDYRLQMQMIGYARRLYPKVHLSLHAGELAPGLVPPEGLRFHIREAVETGQAERIGHGADISYETDAAGLAAEMKKRRVLVEINLTSNDLILGIRGKDHPFPFYRKSGVPVALSTDDEGVSRTNLTQEYLRATLDYGLSYAELKEMVRNSLEYSFAPGASYWRNGAYEVRSAACAAGITTSTCQTFLKANEKARLQEDLEQRFAKFEAKQ